MYSVGKQEAQSSQMLEKKLMIKVSFSATFVVCFLLKQSVAWKEVYM